MNNRVKIQCMWELFIKDGESCSNEVWLHRNEYALSETANEIIVGFEKGLCIKCKAKVSQWKYRTLVRGVEDKEEETDLQKCVRMFHYFGIYANVTDEDNTVEMLESTKGEMKRIKNTLVLAHGLGNMGANVGVEFHFDKDGAFINYCVEN